MNTEAGFLKKEFHLQKKVNSYLPNGNFIPGTVPRVLWFLKHPILLDVCVYLFIGCIAGSLWEVKKKSSLVVCVLMFFSSSISTKCYISQ